VGNKGNWIWRNPHEREFAPGIIKSVFSFTVNPAVPLRGPDAGDACNYMIFMANPVTVHFFGFKKEDRKVTNPLFPRQRKRKRKIPFTTLLISPVTRGSGNNYNGYSVILTPNFFKIFYGKKK